MRIGNLSGRLTLFADGGAVDVAAASGGRFGSDPQAIYDVWDDFTGWASSLGQVDATDFQLTDLQAPTPAPAQVFAIGLNYRDHAVESNLAVPDTFPPVFTKFRTRSGSSSPATYSSARSPASVSCVRRSSPPNGAYRAVAVKTRLHQPLAVSYAG